MGLFGPFAQFNAHRLFYVVVAIRIVAALISPIGDCDETFNYWEPTHFLLFGKGFQTWEYSPEYGLRSYFYICLHAAVAKVVSFFTSDKLIMFFAIRVALASFAAVCDWTFLNAIFLKFGKRVWALSLILLISSSGTFFASISYLPSTFSMYFLELSFAAWMRGSWSWAVCMTAAAVIWGWPFCIVVSIPLALHVIIANGFFRTLLDGFASLMYFLLPMVAFDYYFYHKVFIAPINIILYNVLNPDLGPSLYGVEPWYFYILNGVLNFNIAFVLALAIVPLGLLVWVVRRIWSYSPLAVYTAKQYVLYGSPFLLWFFAMTVQPHKEERFLYVAYPSICLSAAMCLNLFVEHLSVIDFSLAKKSLRITSSRSSSSSSSLSSSPPAALQKRKKESFSYGFNVTITWIIVLLCVVVSISRIIALVMAFRAPMTLYVDLDRQELAGIANHPKNICVGKEWYHFPSNFFLSSPQHDLRYLQSKFDGCLPKPFESTPNATYVIPSDMNNRNEEEPSRYVDISECDYIVDLEFAHQQEDHYLSTITESGTGEFDVLFSYPYLSAVYSKRLTRSFFIPFLSTKRNHYDVYYVLRRK